MSRIRITISLLSCLVALAGCQDASKLVAPNGEPSLDLDGGFTGYTEVWSQWDLVWIDPGGGNPQWTYVTEPNSEDPTNVAHAETFYQYVIVFCDNPGFAWVKAHTGNGYWKIYGITCIEGPPPAPG